MSEFHAVAPQATASEGLAQGPYVAVIVGFEPTTLRSTGIESTNEPPRPTILYALTLTGCVNTCFIIKIKTNNIM